MISISDSAKEKILEVLKEENKEESFLRISIGGMG